jgi:choline dehydrogenase-like flavoprotein
MPSSAVSDNEIAVVVIGSGAGGGTLANELSQRGIDVVVLEAGARYDLEDFLADEWGDAAGPWEMANWRDKRILTGTSQVVSDYATSPTWVLKTVGGTTVHWAAQAYRFMEAEWMPVSRYGPIHGANMLDWPMDLASLTSYYERAERKMGVTGRNGVPFLPHTRLYEIFAAGCRALGYQDVFEGHVAVNPRGRAVPMDRAAWAILEAHTARIARLSGLDPPHVLLVLQGCRGGPKWSALNTEIPEAEATGHCEVRARCTVLRIEHNRAGRATGVLYRDASGMQHVQKAKLVCLAGNAIESPRLLLNSASPLFPDGLANSSGQVGANYLRNMIAFIYGQFDDPVNMTFGNPVPGIVFTGSGSEAFAGELSFAGLGYGLPLYASYGKQGTLGRSYAEALPFMAGVVATGSDLPMERNHVTLHQAEKDDSGLPIPVLNLDIHPNETAMQSVAIKRARDILEAAGARRVFVCPPLPSSHNLGTNRMSRSPRDGVCNQWGRTHDVANLFISDGSQFPSCNVGHPTLTIVALAIRQAEYIAEALRRGDL